MKMKHLAFTFAATLLASCSQRKEAEQPFAFECKGTYTAFDGSTSEETKSYLVDPSARAVRPIVNGAAVGTLCTGANSCQINIGPDRMSAKTIRSKTETVHNNSGVGSRQLTWITRYVDTFDLARVNGYLQETTDYTWKMDSGIDVQPAEHSRFEGTCTKIILPPVAPNQL